jgi:aminomethyltransferase
VIDDGTVTRVSHQVFRWTAADPNLRWFTENASGLDAHIEDISEEVAALALQGPTSARLLREVCDADLSSLNYFRATSGSIAGVPVDVSRTGYTGDLGYELWMPWNSALHVWDAIVSAGSRFDLHPTGMLALDVARIEAGLLLIDVDFQSSRKALIESQKYSPFELGLGRLVDMKKPAFVGRAALREEMKRGIARMIVGLEVDWTGVEQLYDAVGLPPTAPAAASRVAVPIYSGRTQVGKATSTTWSTTLKKLIALATVDAPHYAIGTKLEMEMTVEAVRHRTSATVVPTPFFNPERKMAKVIW